MAAAAPARLALTATELRKSLFQQLEQVSAGSAVYFTFKGKRMRIELDLTEPTPSKLARLVAHPDPMQVSDQDLMQWNANWMSEWEAKWNRRKAEEAAEELAGGEQR